DDREFTIRYFLDKYPLFVTPGARENSTDPVTFCFVDEGLVSLSRFETYLAQYRDLFRNVLDFQLVYVADRDTHFAGARTTFERFRKTNVGASGAHSAAERAELLTYFRLRERYERRQFNQFNRAQLIQLRDGRDRYSNPEIESFYGIWKSGGDVGIL